MFAYGRPVTVYLEIRERRHGDVTRGDERVVHGVTWWPRTSTEGAGTPGVGGDLRTARLTTGLTMLAPVGHGITARHRVILPDGQEYRVEGTPGQWRSPMTGWSPGDQIELERVEG